jgi:hypothetical protein
VHKLNTNRFFPLVIVSHGYPGSRLIFTYLTENLASKGYVVVSIDHAESTFRDLAGFPSTLLSHALDQLFVLNQIAALRKTGSKSFLSGLVDSNNTAPVGYYTGAINADRYLLTYDNARHNTAPNPPPPESLKPSLIDEYNFYAEPAWNEYHINNINQHFVTAFVGILLKNKDYGKYLDLNENSNEKNWTGFKPRSAVGSELLHAVPAEK